MSWNWKIFTLFVFSVVTRCGSSTENADVLPFDTTEAKISLETYNDHAGGNGRAFSRAMILPPNKTLEIVVTDIPPVVAFLIVQIHTYQYNVTLAYERTFTPRRYTAGTNLGLVIDHLHGLNIALAYVRNDNALEVQTLLAVVAYPESAPVPGGCNMEFDTEIAPYQKLAVTESTVAVDIQPAGAGNSKSAQAPVRCERNGVQHEMYLLFLPEQDFTTDSYFSGITEMLTVEGIRANGRMIPASASGSKMRRTYSAYPGTGSLYAAIAVNPEGNESAAYVPAFTYACSPLSLTDTCQVLNSPFAKVLCAVTLFLGFFATFVGHKYFKTEMFLLGFLAGGIASYITIAIVGSYGPSGNIGISVVLGCLLGFVWLGFWWLYAIPVLSILLATLTLGFFCSCIAYFGSPAGVSYLENDTNFWLIFTLIILLVPLILSTIPHRANIICCAILGSYTVIISIDHYAGSNLKYIIVNTIRRATWQGFNLAVIHPPYQVKDICLTVCWIILAMAGTGIQLRQNRGKPPFPPGNRILPSEERTPLLSNHGRIFENQEEEDFDSGNRKWYDGFLKKMLKKRGVTTRLYPSN